MHRVTNIRDAAAFSTLRAAVLYEMSWGAEQCFELAQDDGGLDGYEVRS